GHVDELQEQVAVLAVQKAEETHAIFAHHHVGVERGLALDWTENLAVLLRDGQFEPDAADIDDAARLDGHDSSPHARDHFAVTLHSPPLNACHIAIAMASDSSARSGSSRSPSIFPSM